MSIYEQALAAQAIRLHDDDLAGLFDTLVSEPIADLSIVPDVGVVLVSRKWQHSAMDDALTNPDAEAIPFVITGPADVVALLQHEASTRIRSSEMPSYGGFLSPPHPVTIKGARAKRAGIPENAAYYAFAYPVESLFGQFERLVGDGGGADSCEPWLLFLLLGGYCYFDADRKLIQVNAIGIQPTAHTLSLAGPFQPSHAAVAALCAAARLRELTLECIREKGLSHFAWVNPGERPGGNMLLANGGELPNNGAFVYQSASGEAVVYSVINKALLGVQEDKDGTRTSEHFSPLSVTPGRLSGWSMSGRMENAALHLDRWTESSRRESGGEQGEQKKGAEADAGKVPLPVAQEAKHVSFPLSTEAKHVALLRRMRAAADAGDKQTLNELMNTMERHVEKLQREADGAAQTTGVGSKIEVAVVGERRTKPGGAGSCCALM